MMQDHGFSHCFIDTVSSFVLFSFICIFGGVQLLVYRKYSDVLDAQYRPQSSLFYFQIILSLVMAMESVVRFILQLIVIGNKTVYIYNIVSLCFMVLAWSITIMLVLLERRCVLPSISTRGHGLVLLVFWTTAFIVENLALVSWFSEEWWWIHRDHKYGLYGINA